jgi:uncharacterized coiled-coil protein SlyX
MALAQPSRYREGAVMAEAQRNGAKSAIKVPDFLKSQLEQAQARLVHFEESAQRTLKELMDKGRASRKDLEVLIAKVSKDDRVAEFKERLEKLQREGAHRAEVLRDRAEEFRTDALERIIDFQGKAISFLGVASRDQVEELHRELDRLAKRFEKSEKARPAKKAGKKAEA